MFWIGFLIGILVLPALAGLTALVLFLIDAIPYFIRGIKMYFKNKKERRSKWYEAKKKGEIK
ncbi:MAG: hypothetical protein EOL97_09850 [Spirochaetia bacterium]|nr:hypothetical protein [Spirochaetia bacterium]